MKLVPDKLIRLIVAVTATLSLITGVFAAFAADRWWSLRTVGTEDNFVATSKAGKLPVPTGPCSVRACNYLLLGSDSRAGLPASQQKAFGTNSDIGGTNRADTIMLVHTDPNA